MARIARPIPPSVRERAYKHVTFREDGCWISAFGLKSNGYAHLTDLTPGGARRRKVRRGKWMVNVCWGCMDDHNANTTAIRKQLRLLEIAYGLGDWHKSRMYRSTVNARNARVIAVRDERLGQARTGSSKGANRG